MGDVVTAAHAARAALAAHEGGPAVAVVTLLDGPGAGRRLMLFETGEARGTLGGETFDARALELARGALEGAAATVETVDAAGTPVRIDSVVPGAANAPHDARDLGTADAVSSRVHLYVEAHRAPEELVIVGAGHIAVPISRLGVMLGYRVVVLDDREGLATPDRFPGAAEVRRMDFDDPFRDVPIGPRSHVLLVTRAHRYDFDCLLRLLQSDTSPGYIGMIGSRRRVRAAFHALLEAGVPRERLATVSAPVGLDIGAETPEEIAVAIAAELIGLRRAGARAKARPRARGASEMQPRSSSERALDHEVEAVLAGRDEGRQPERLADRERVLDRLLPEEHCNG